MRVHKTREYFNAVIPLRKQWFQGKVIPHRLKYLDGYRSKPYLYCTTDNDPNYVTIMEINQVPKGQTKPEGFLIGHYDSHKDIMKVYVKLEFKVVGPLPFIIEYFGGDHYGINDQEII